MLSLFSRAQKVAANARLVVCQFCGNATAYHSGAMCEHCGVAVTKFDVSRLEPAFAAQPADIRLIKGDHGMLPTADVRGGYYDRAGTWVRLLGERFDLASMGTVTDVGSGSNFFLNAIARAYPNLRCTGFDFRPGEPGSDVRDRISVHQMDLERGKIPLGDGSQDVVLCSHVLEHVENAHQLLAEILRVGRNAFIILPNGVDIWTIARSVLKDGPAQPYGIPLERPADRHRWIFTPTQAVRLMSHWAGRTQRTLEIVHLTHPRFPVAFGRISPNLFVAETAFVLSR